MTTSRSPGKRARSAPEFSQSPGAFGRIARVMNLLDMRPIRPSPRSPKRSLENKAARVGASANDATDLTTPAARPRVHSRGVAHTATFRAGFVPPAGCSSCFDHSRSSLVGGPRLAVDPSILSSQMALAPIWVAAWESPTSKFGRAVYRVIAD
jgi:hypothetical protein